MIPGLAFILLAPIGALAQSAAIGPVTDLTIVNAFLQPDGFNRSFVLANGVFPGPPIVGNIVRLRMSPPALVDSDLHHTERATTSKLM